MKRSTLIAAMVTVIAAALPPSAAANPKPEDTWPGFRGHAMSGIAPGVRVPEKWSTTENVAWKTAVPGQGWSSPIVWGDTVFVTSGITGKPFKQPTPGLYGNEYIAQLRDQGLSGDEIEKRVRARDTESPEESDDIRYMVYALDAQTGKIKWEQEAHRAKPSGGRHRKNTYASETPFTDGERLYVSFGQNVGLFCYTLDGKLLWKKHWPPQPIYLDFGTASSPIAHEGRLYLLHDSEAESFVTALDAKTGEELWRTARPAIGLPRSSWTTPFVWTNETRTEIVTLGHGMILSYGLDGKELWRVSGMSMPTASPLAANGWLYVGSGSQGDANRPFLAIKPGASGDITPAPGTDSNDFIVWRHPRASGYTPSALVHQGKAYLVHDTGILAVLNAKTGEQIYKVRVGGGGHTFSASPVAAGNRVYLLDETGTMFVLDGGDAYKEIATNDLGEMTLASPAIAGGSIYVRTETKIYRIGK
ncbi:MAG TPA: PQQ-binding-like beta-propeller repeat protein [Vicinamibacterales bacterium]|jgi:outer membrane protein assembly factor BamB